MGQNSVGESFPDNQAESLPALSGGKEINFGQLPMTMLAVNTRKYWSLSSYWNGHGKDGLKYNVEEGLKLMSSIVTSTCIAHDLKASAKLVRVVLRLRGEVINKDS